MGEKPLRKEGVKAQAAGEEWLLHDSRKGDVHVINGTAKFVWDLCDGEKTMTDMEAAVRMSYDVPADEDIRGMIEGILRRFTELGTLSGTP